jgi:hypothetical protein
MRALPPAARDASVDDRVTAVEGRMSEMRQRLGVASRLP